jgi:hypothetical protein
MDLLKIYYYTSIPILTCNMLFYSITILSTSITSSQNVIKFVTENKTCDSVKFKDELELLDIQNKLKIVESLIFNIIKKKCETNDEFEKLKTTMLNPSTLSKEIDDFIMIENNYEYENAVLNRIEEPLRIALLSTSEVVQNINNTIVIIHNKILNYEKSFLNKIIKLCLQKELKQLTKYMNLFDKRLELLFQLLKIYN